MLKIVFKNAKLVTHLVDAFASDEAAEAADPSIDPGAASRCWLTAVEKKCLRGFVINATNAIRLQVHHSHLAVSSPLMFLQTAALPPSAFLRNFLHSHQRWNSFIPLLRVSCV